MVCFNVVKFLVLVCVSGFMEFEEDNRCKVKQYGLDLVPDGRGREVCHCLA